MKKHLPFLLTLFFALPTATSFRSPGSVDGFNLQEAERLPVLMNGRVKPLDSVARTSLLVLRGKQSLRRDGKTIPPVRWMMDVLAAPDRSDKDPLFRVEDPDLLGFLGKDSMKKSYFSFDELTSHLGAIDERAHRAESLPAPQRSGFQSAVLNLQNQVILYQRLRLSLRPPETEDFADELAAYKNALEPGLKALTHHQTAATFDRKALETLGAFIQKYEFASSVSAFLPVPPPDGAPKDHWITVGDALMAPIRGGKIAPEIGLFASLADAWKSGDAPAFNQALAALVISSKAKVPEAVSMGRRETLFNRVDPFTQGMTIYIVAFLLAILSWLLWPETLQRSAFGLLVLAFLLHTGGLAWRIILQGRPPVTNLYSSAIFVGWGAVLAGILLERMSRRGFGTAAAAAIGFSTLIIAHHLMGQGDTMEMMRAVLDSNFWLATHVVTITIGYSAAFVAGALAHLYIFRARFSRSFDGDQRTALTRMVYGTICFTLLFSFVGTVLGGIWADQSWGRFWGWDPKENGALLIFLWNAVILHALWAKYVSERGLMVMAVFGNIITALSWFGVNMLGVGLHSYGFMDKAFWSLSAFVGFQGIVMLLGATTPLNPRSQGDR